jgi:hypothetical protein
MSFVHEPLLVYAAHVLELRSFPAIKRTNDTTAHWGGQLLV